MTAATPEATTAPAAPTEPVPPAAGPTPFTPQTPPGGSAAQPPAPPQPPARRTPWYRRAWVLAVGAALLALLSFGSGFIAGSATSFVRAVGGTMQDFEERGVPGGPGPGFGDREGDGDGGFRGFGDTDTDSDDATRN